MSITPARGAALDAMRAIRAGALADRAFDVAAGALDARDRAWLHELLFGTLRLRGRLDHRLAALSKRPLPALEPDILDILRLGTYQLTEMGGVPAYAAVSQSVDLAKLASRGASGFVNGVLQSLRRAGGASTFPPLETDPAAHLSTWGSHPRWLVERWIAQFGVADTARLVEANNTRPDLYLRVLGDDVAAARTALAAAGVVTEAVPWAPLALRVTEGSAAQALEVAPVIVQDPASGAVVTFGDDPAAVLILDLAAAPGGKALALAHAPDAPPDRLVAAADLSRSRLRRLEENTRRLARRPPEGTGQDRVLAVVADGRMPPFAAADLVLLDAPCTGTGTLRRHPDGRWRLQPADLGALVRLQHELLDAAASCVRPGGLLVYSTCSLEPEENEVQVADFLERNVDFTLERVSGADATITGADGMLRVLPQAHGTDGSYAARLRRRGG